MGQYRWRAPTATTIRRKKNHSNGETKMAASVSIALFNAFIFCSFISAISVHSAENTTSEAANSTAATEQNSASGFTEPPPVAAEPLPVFGSLPAPAGADRACPCDQHAALCDVNCCCDRECSGEVALFTRCSAGEVRSGSQRLCSQDVARYILRTTAEGYSELQSTVQKETSFDLVCIQSQNRFDGLSHPSPPLPTDRNFDSLFSQSAGFMFGSEGSSGAPAAEVQAKSGYKFGDVLATAEKSGQKGIFYLPAPGVTAECVNNSPAAFLKEQSSRCSQRGLMDGDCSSMQALRMDTYANIQLLAGKSTDTAVVPVGVASVVVESMEGARAERTVGDGVSLLPELINSTVCANVVLKAVYAISYSAAGELVNASVSLLLGFLRRGQAALQQEFQLTFSQVDGGQRGVHYSGNPGYVVGMPLVSGDRTADGMSRSVELRDSLSLLRSAGDQDCLRAPHQRSPVLFGLDFVSGCTLRLEDVTNCSIVSQELLDVLRGANSPQYVASFGNSPLENVLDWVPVKTSVSPTPDAQSCSIPVSLHLEVEWTKLGSLVNPQAQIVNIREVIETNRSSLALLSGSSSILPIRSSVAFSSVSAAAAPGYRATPSINAKLPSDFFFPFV